VKKKDDQLEATEHEDVQRGEGEGRREERGKPSVGCCREKGPSCWYCRCRGVLELRENKVSVSRSKVEVNNNHART